MRLIVYTVFFLITSGLFGQEKTSIEVISDTAKYSEQIKENPNNKLVDLEGFVPGLNLDIRFAGLSEQRLTIRDTGRYDNAFDTFQ